ncbi:MAG: hypothetical protein H7Y38_19920 [Armatimonadetes bacterium]|nr:hypothetical protein [Armatimonadota bacterium]
MSYWLPLYIWLAVVGMAVLLVAVLLVPLLLFSKGSKSLHDLQKQGKTGEAYQVGQELLRLVQSSLLRKAYNAGYAPLLILQLAQLAHTLGDADAATDWTRRVTDGGYSATYRTMALRQQATWLRAANREGEAQVLEAQALALAESSSGEPSETGANIALSASLLTKRGQFAEALRRIEVARPAASSTEAIGLASQEAAILCAMGRYDEAIAAHNRFQSELETIQENLHKSSIGVIPGMVRKSFLNIRIASELKRIHLCLRAGKVGAAGETWDALPPDVVDDDTEALRYATGAWLFAVRGDEDKARRLLADMPTTNAAKQKTSVQELVGLALFALRDYDAAATQFQIVLTQCAGKPLAQAEAHARLAACYAKQERDDLARAEYEAVIAAGFEEAVFTSEARTQLSRLQNPDAPEPLRLANR